MTENIKSIQNAFEIIECLHLKGKAGVSELSSSLNLPKTTTHRVLKTLKNLNIVNQDNDEVYSLGYSMFKYAQGIEHDQALINTAQGPMQFFSNETGETINLGIFLDEEVLIIHSSVGDSYTLQPSLSQSSPLYCSGMGKVFLSKFKDDRLKEYFDKDLKKRTVNTITNQEDYKKEKNKFLENKLAYDNEEYEYGLSCISTAVYNEDGDIIAALSVSGPSSRLKYKGVERLENLLLETSQAITKEMK